MSEVIKLSFVFHLKYFLSFHLLKFHSVHKLYIQCCHSFMILSIYIFIISNHCTFPRNIETNFYENSAEEHGEKLFQN